MDHGSGHAKYVGDGYCSSTMPGNPKCWCNGKDKHLGAHWALRLEPSMRVTTIRWIGSVIQA